VDAVERVSDLLIAVVLIAVTLPLMVIVALAIRLDSVLEAGTMGIARPEISAA